MIKDMYFDYQRHVCWWSFKTELTALPVFDHSMVVTLLHILVGVISYDGDGDDNDDDDGDDDGGDHGDNITCDADVEVAVAPPARKTFFCTFGAISRLSNMMMMAVIMYDDRDEPDDHDDETDDDDSTQNMVV